jgi:hypothetical protein
VTQVVQSALQAQGPQFKISVIPKPKQNERGNGKIEKKGFATYMEG